MSVIFVDHATMKMIDAIQMMAVHCRQDIAVVYSCRLVI